MNEIKNNVPIAFLNNDYEIKKPNNHISDY